MEEITVQPGTAEAAEAGEWEINVAEMMQGVVDEAEPAMNAKPEKPAEAESFTLRHLGETKNVGREEVIALAQKGMDYDRIRSKLGDASREIESLRSGGTGEISPEERRRRDCESFVKSFPEAAARLRTDREAIPAEVWDEVRRGVSLTDAYAAHLSRREAARSVTRALPAPLRAGTRAPRARKRPPQRRQRRLRRRRPAL